MSNEPQIWWTRVEDCPWRELGPCTEATALAFISDVCRNGGAIYLTTEPDGDPLYAVHWSCRENKPIIHERPVRPRYWKKRNG